MTIQHDLSDIKELWVRPCYLPDAAFNAIVELIAKRERQAYAECAEMIEGSMPYMDKHAANPASALDFALADRLDELVKQLQAKAAATAPR